MSSPGRRMWKKLARVAWIPVVTTAISVALAGGFVATSGAADASYVSTLVVLVPATPPTPTETTVDVISPTSTTVYDPLGRPTEALRAASNYAELIPQDGQIRLAVAEAAGLTDNEVSGRISATAVPDSSLIVITFEATSSGASQAGITAIEAAIIGESPATPAIPPRSLIVVSTGDPERAGGGAFATLLSAGILGAAFGSFLAYAWSRAAARIDGSEDVETVTDSQVIEIEHYVASEAEFAKRSLRLLLDGHLGPAADGEERTVAVVSVDDTAAPAARMAAGLATGLTGSDAAAVDVTFGGVSGTPDAVTAAMESDGVVLAVLRGGRTSRLREATAQLARLGRAPDAVFVLSTFEEAAPEDGGAAADAKEEEVRIPEGPTKPDPWGPPSRARR